MALRLLRLRSGRSPACFRIAAPVVVEEAGRRAAFVCARGGAEYNRDGPPHGSTVVRTSAVKVALTVAQALKHRNGEEGHEPATCTLKRSTLSGLRQLHEYPGNRIQQRRCLSVLWRVACCLPRADECPIAREVLSCSHQGCLPRYKNQIAARACAVNQDDLYYSESSENIGGIQVKSKKG